MELNGLYARLYSMQFRDAEEELAVVLSAGNHNGEAPIEKQTGLLDIILRRT